MSKKKYIIQVIALLGLCAIACTKEPTASGDGTKTSVTFGLKLSGSNNSDTRAMIGDRKDNRVNDITLMVFEDSGDEGGAYLYRRSEIEPTVSTTGEGDGEFTASLLVTTTPIVIHIFANNHGTDLNTINFNGQTEAQVIESLTTGVELNNALTTALPMHGRLKLNEISAEMGSLGVTYLLRSVARMDIVKGVAGFTLEGVSVYGSPSVGRMVSEHRNDGTISVPVVTAPTLPSPVGDLATFNMAATEGAIENALFLYENDALIAGNNGSGNGSRLVVYGKVTGVDGVTDNSTRYYPVDFTATSVDGTVSYRDILRNHHYTVTVTSITGAGYASADEAAKSGYDIAPDLTAKIWVETTFDDTNVGSSGNDGNTYDWVDNPDVPEPFFGKILPPANTYMVPMTGGRFRFEAITRANQYSPTAIGDTDEWYAEIIWADFDPVAHPVIIKQNFNAKGSGKTEALELIIPDLTLLGKGGNVIIGLKNADQWGTPETGLYRWSWHIWITDYKPDDHGSKLYDGGSLDQGFDVTKGEVHRYNDVTGTVLWAGIGDYANKVIMDRNLGATWTGGTPVKGTNAAKSITAWGMFYQWGRKDPFPHATATLNSTTTTATWVLNNWDVFITTLIGPLWNGTQTGGIPSTVNHPTKFNPDWNLSQWTDVPVTKSIYDPCPDGWRVPINGTWSNFGSGVSPEQFLGNGGNIAGVNWGRTYIGSVEADNRVAAWYPASGNRNNASGELSIVGDRGYSWSSSVNETHGYYTDFSPTHVTTSYDDTRAYGLPVRCLQE